MRDDLNRYLKEADSEDVDALLMRANKNSHAQAS
jgi:hypothetical protein